jgi:hypothetical protein
MGHFSVLLIGGLIPEYPNVLNFIGQQAIPGAELQLLYLNSACSVVK